MIKREVYISCDGKEFPTEEACIGYEKCLAEQTDTFEVAISCKEEITKVLNKYNKNPNILVSLVANYYGSINVIAINKETHFTDEELLIDVAKGLV